jgi:hypothetical protein
MDDQVKHVLWRQFGAAIDMMGNAIDACPDALWGDRESRPEFWYLAFHTLWWLDRYLADDPETHTPPPPYGMEEMDPAGVIPERPYTKDELRAFLRHGRERCRTVIYSLTDETARVPTNLGSRAVGTRLEALLYNLRHVQHHAAQLNLLLRQRTGDDAPRWVAIARE